MRGGTAIVINPASGGGRTARRLPEIARWAQEALGDAVVMLPTRAPGDGRARAEEAAAGGAALVVALGGDGTASEVVDGLLVARGEDCLGDPSAGPAFGLVHMGSGGDLARTLGVPRHPRDGLRALARGQDRPLDAIAVRWPDGTRRFGVNMLSGAVSAEVVRRANASPKWFGGPATFFGATVASMLAWSAVPAQVRWGGPEGDDSWSGDLLALFLGNGVFAGGGMRLSEGAVPDDGLLDLTLLEGTWVPALLRHLPKIYGGGLGRVPGARVARVAWLEVGPSGAARLPMELDGENLPDAPLRAEVLRHALRVRWPG
jgi:diacylglycerol kinase (ATP)